MTIQPFSTFGSYRGCTLTDAKGNTLYQSTTGEYLRDLACCVHAIRERSIQIEPLPINLTPAMPTRPAVVAAETIP